MAGTNIEMQFFSKLRSNNHPAIDIKKITKFEKSRRELGNRI